MSASASAAPARRARGGNWLSRKWNRLTPRGKRVFGGGLIGLFLLFVGTLGAVYAAAKVPLPQDFDNAQATIVEYADGSRMDELAKENRVDIPLEQVPPHVRDAVLAAEDRGYYKHSGISVTGIARAAFQDVFGRGAKQGGSTITQQYARNKFLTQHRTFARKFREAVIAVKLDRKYSKDQVLEWYLNTIYFGRGASGIEAAAQTYFGVPAKSLTVEQGAVLAALIRSPEGGDPAVNPEVAKRRWHAVLDGMVETKKLTREQADAAKYPKVLPRKAKSKGGGGDGPIGFVREAVHAELKANGFSDDEIFRGGLRVRTTIERKRQDAAVKAVTAILDDPARDPHAALVAVEPGTGRVLAMYGGRDYGGKGDKSFINYALNKRQPGSSFKPFVLAAALDDGVSLKSTFDGRSPQTFANYPVENFGNEQFGRIDLVQATAHSVNTVYVPLGMKVGFDKTMDTTHRLGVGDDITCDDHKDATLYLGTCELRPTDEAAAFAAFAARGKAAGWHLVETVRDHKGKKVYGAGNEAHEALSAGEAADATYAMRAVVEQGTARAARLDRPAAGKTGTTSDNTNAWFSGYVPQLAATVWLGYEPVDTNNDGKPDKIPPLRNLHGFGEVTGGTLPARIWHDFMAAALEGVPVEDFPPPSFGGKALNPSASPSATPSTTASATPTETPSATPTVEVTITPTVVVTVEPTKNHTTPPPETTTAAPTSSSPTQAPPSGQPPPS